MPTYFGILEILKVNAALINATYALVVGTCLLVLVTAALVFVTWKYVSHTKKMADVMAKDHELKIKPLVHIMLSELDETQHDIYKRDIILTNDGVNTAILHYPRCYLYVPDYDEKDSILRELFNIKELIELEPGESKRYTMTVKKEYFTSTIFYKAQRKKLNKTMDYVIGDGTLIKIAAVKFEVDIAGTDQKFETIILDII